MIDFDFKAAFEKSKANREKLNACPRHQFGELPPLNFGMKITCLRCGGKMDVIEAAAYAQGYEAGCRNPDEIIAEFKCGDHKGELVNCPVCKGECAVDAAAYMNVGNDEHMPDWHDCDFCTATGKVAREAALLYLDRKQTLDELTAEGQQMGLYN